MVEFLFLDFILLIVKVSYAKSTNSKSQKVIDEIYKITTPGVSIEPSGSTDQRGTPFENVKVLKWIQNFQIGYI